VLPVVPTEAVNFGMLIKTIFWICAAWLAYSYLGYPLLLWIAAKIRRRPIKRAEITPTVSIIIAARNEAVALPTKLANLRELDYPQDRLQVIVVSDGSTDRSVAVLGAEPRVDAIILEEPAGKAAALNEGVRRAEGEILVFLDARQRIGSSAIRELVACFADPEVGAVSGELILGSETPSALETYWSIEKTIRKLESATGSVVGVTGAIYAVRRELFKEIPRGTILDDVYVPMQVVRKGKRVVLQSSAVAFDLVHPRQEREFLRKVRTLTGNYQLLRLNPWLLGPSNPILFRFVSHKLLRLACPLLLIGLLVSSALSPEILLRAVFAAQVLMYGLAALGAAFPRAKHFKPVAVTDTFVMLNVAAAVALFNFMAQRKATW